MLVDQLAEAAVAQKKLKQRCEELKPTILGYMNRNNVSVFNVGDDESLFIQERKGCKLKLSKEDAVIRMASICYNGNVEQAAQIYTRIFDEGRPEGEPKTTLVRRKRKAPKEGKPRVKKAKAKQ